MASQEYFVDGGTLKPENKSYVTRSADHELLQKAQEGSYCYVLTARQMGKSSMTIRAAEQLRAKGIKVANVDLTETGTYASVDQWYVGLLTNIVRELELTADVATFWQLRGHLPPTQRFINFLHDIVLQSTKNRIVIFIDEIDSILSLNFDIGADFLVAIRALYNARAKDALYERLTFILLGVATPTDLIKDTEKDFNIGSRIMLQEFNFDDATPLREGLEYYYGSQGEYILRRIFHWTNGHPYLTQHLCLAIVKAETRQWNSQQIDDLVERTYFSDEARRDPNLTFVRNRVRKIALEERQAMLELYHRVYTGEKIIDDDYSQPQLLLKLFGLVRAEQGHLCVCNEIYRYVFNETWITENLRAIWVEQRTPTSVSNSEKQSSVRPINWTFVVIAGIVALALVALVAIWFLR